MWNKVYIYTHDDYNSKVTGNLNIKTLNRFLKLVFQEATRLTEQSQSLKVVVGLKLIEGEIKPIKNYC